MIFNRFAVNGAPDVMLQSLCLAPAGPPPITNHQSPFTPTPIGLASEAALHGCRAFSPFTFHLSPLTSHFSPSQSRLTQTDPADTFPAPSFPERLLPRQNVPGLDK